MDRLCKRRNDMLFDLDFVSISILPNNSLVVRYTVKLYLINFVYNFSWQFWSKVLSVAQAIYFSGSWDSATVFHLCCQFSQWMHVLCVARQLFCVNLTICPKQPNKHCYFHRNGFFALHATQRSRLYALPLRPLYILVLVPASFERKSFRFIH